MKRLNPVQALHDASTEKTRRKLLEFVPTNSERHPTQHGQSLEKLDKVRAAARHCGAELSLHLDRYWTGDPTATMGPIDVVDMFSGCGGMSAGFCAANSIMPVFRTMLAVDIDKVANKTYAANLHLTPLAEDVSELARDRRKLKKILSLSGRRHGAPLVLIGCAPCQGFSSHRNSKGSQDLRNNLFLDFANVASSLQPDAVIAENVPELLTTRYWPYVEKVVGIFKRQGYYVHLNIYNLARFGVPQERFRAVLLAMRKPFLPPEGFLNRTHFRTVRQAIGVLPPVRPGERHPSDSMHYSAGHCESVVETIRAVPKDGGSRPFNVGPDCLRRASLRYGRPAYEDVYGRLFWDRPAITITASARNPASGRFIHPEQNRGLSVREGALLQSFPSTYQFVGGLDDSFRQVGNAVPPAFSSYLAFHVLGELLGLSVVEGRFDAGIRKPIGSSFSRIIAGIKAEKRDDRNGRSLCA
jgi:DNA (cytosine-5)-methyltransferase 1